MIINILLVDLGGMFHRIYHRYEKTNMNIIEEVKRCFVEEVIFVKKKFMISRVIIANEISRNENWRIDFYPTYKANRDKIKDNDDERKIQQLKKVKNEFYTWCLTLDDINFSTIGEGRCEGDDVIGSIILNKTDDNKYFILSDDKDFQQLLKIRNVTQISIREFDVLYKPIYADLRFHIGVGDSSDGIKNLKKGYGDAKITKLIETGMFEKFVEENNLTEQYNLNRRLIDMTLIPQEYQKSIIDKFNKIINSCQTNSLSKVANFLYDLQITTVDVTAFIRL